MEQPVKYSTSIPVRAKINNLILLNDFCSIAKLLVELLSHPRSPDEAIYKLPLVTLYFSLIFKMVILLRTGTEFSIKLIRNFKMHLHVIVKFFA